MSDNLTFEPPMITDDEIRWASRLLQLPDDAFYGETGTDPRHKVLKSMERMDIAACPGSGKTTLLVAKLAILANTWRHSTRGICVLSHTNAARREIEDRLGNTASGQRLLAYPHFVGTIHAFVNEFLAIPWLRSRGYPIKMIDTAVSLNRRWDTLPRNTRDALTKAKHDGSILSIQSVDFRVGPISWSQGFLGEDTQTYTTICRICEQSISEGYHCHDEMFVWAENLIHKVPDIIDVLRGRFPFLFIDEAQDNKEMQAAILHRIFLAGGDPVLCQRFGDGNQAIFDFVDGEEATTDLFPNDTIKEVLPNSHRFGQKIADLADPFGIVPHELVGQGPKKQLASGEKEAPHTIFLFEESSIGGVLDAYGELLVKTFSEEELRTGDFVAAGMVHRPQKTGKNNKIPHSVGHYWPAYSPQQAKNATSPSSLADYIRVGLAESHDSAETFPILNSFANGIIRLSERAFPEGLRHKRRSNHQLIIELLEGNTSLQRKYLALTVRLALRRRMPSENAWNNGWQQAIISIVQGIANTNLQEHHIEDFLTWTPNADASSSSSTLPNPRGNRYAYPPEAPLVDIRVGSIHSIKGETHTATLVLETHHYAFNLSKLRKWILGERRGWSEKDKALQHKRLKTHYVAMTRPSHLLCLAMKREAFFEKSGKALDQPLIDSLRNRGWRIQEV